MSGSSNIAEKLSEHARLHPDQPAVVKARRARNGVMHYDSVTFGELDRNSDTLARGLIQHGVTPGKKMVLMVPPGPEFFSLTFALFKAGAIVVLIDPGMGRSNIFRCLQEIEPDGFVAVPLVHVVRLLSPGKFPTSRIHVTVGRRWFWGGATYRQLAATSPNGTSLPQVNGDDPAAVIFTSGSTGPPKGVLYEHGMFNAQVEQLRHFFNIQPGDRNLAGFPLFALFDAGMGVTSIIPDMNPTRPADVEPNNVLDPIRDYEINQAFGSPALWNRVSRFCVERQTRIPHLERILTAGAPLPLPILERVHSVLERPEADIYPPYGATESLPVACIAGRTMRDETSVKTAAGAGTCVGHPFRDMQVKIIRISDAPLPAIDGVEELPAGEIGEILVHGPVTTKQYYAKPDATAAAKVADGPRIWHRMGDVGYLDEDGRLWFCGRKAHIVHTACGPLYTEQCEPVFNQHPRVDRTALVGVGPRGQQTPVIVVEPEPGQLPQTDADRAAFAGELRDLARGCPLTQSIETFLFHPSLPVDIRHNVKINREQLAVWAAAQPGATAS